MANEIPFPEPQAPTRPAAQPVPAQTQAQSFAQQQSQPMTMPAAGNFSVALPEEWGGRPTGSTRRAIRKQKEWDDNQEQMSKMIQAQQRSEAEAQTQARLQAQEIREAAKYRASQDIDFQTDKEANNIMAWLNGTAVDNQGNPMPKPNPQDPNFRNQLDTVISYNRVGYDSVKDIVGRYSDAHDKYMEGLATRQEAEKSQAEDRAKRQESLSKEMKDVAEVATLSGKPMSEFVTTSPTTGMDVIDWAKVGAAKGGIEKSKQTEPTAKVSGFTIDDLNKTIANAAAEVAAAKAEGKDTSGLEAKLTYYQGLVPAKPSEAKSVAPTAQSQYSSLPPVNERKTGNIYPTPSGDKKWTGTGWVAP